MVQTYRQTGERWEAAYSDLRTEFLTTADTLQRQLQDLEAQVNNERKAWRAEVARSRFNTVVWVLAVGAAGYFAGSR